MISINNLPVIPQKEPYRMLPSALHLFIPFFHWISPLDHEAGRIDKHETCKFCGSSFSIEDPYCPECAKEGLFLHVTISE